VRRGRSLIALACIGAASSAASQIPGTTCVADSVAPRSPRWLTSQVVVDRQDIERWGWSRISELVQRSDWSLSSIDGFIIDASADGLPVSRLSTVGRPDWLVVVDGQRVPVRAAGLGALESLPVAITQVDRVTITRTPLIAAGRFAARGVIDIQTRRVQKPTLHALYQIGNERGDPGPYRYTDLRTINVERLGPDGVVTAFLGGGAVDIQGSARYSTMNVTDANIFPRIERISGDRAHHHRLSAASGRAGVFVACGRHDLLVGGSTFEGLLFAEDSARDGWARATTMHVGVSGDAAVGSRYSVTYALTHSRLRQDTLAGTRAAWANGERSAVDATLGVSALVGRSRLDVSGSIARWSVERRDGATIARDDASARAGIVHARDRIAMELVGGVAVAGGRAAPQMVMGSAHVGVDSASSVRLLAGLGRLHLEGEAWSQSILLMQDDEVRLVPTISFAEAAWQRMLPGGTIELALGATHARRWTMITGDFGDATMLSARASLRVQPLPALAATIDYRLTQSSASVAALRDALRSTPAHQARLTVGTPHLAGNFRLSSSLTFRARTEWIQTDGAGDVSVRQLAPMARLDATLEKRLWRERLRVYVAARNLLDREERYHAAGAHFGLRFHIGVEADIR
jgi:hypothetical protein